MSRSSKGNLRRFHSPLPEVEPQPQPIDHTVAITLPLSIRAIRAVVMLERHVGLHKLHLRVPAMVEHVRRCDLSRRTPPNVLDFDCDETEDLRIAISDWWRAVVGNTDGLQIALERRRCGERRVRELVADIHHDLDVGARNVCGERLSGSADELTKRTGTRQRSRQPSDVFSWTLRTTHSPGTL